ncbi:hypothetical protein Q8G41_28810, partial [Klebsiella pneumoniae]|uniref:hypothetical protein n=1 Tax=Klebsiella pneumoniae TaxID=573 RepID=UPI0030136FF4
EYPVAHGRPDSISGNTPADPIRDETALLNDPETGEPQRSSFSARLFSPLRTSAPLAALSARVAKLVWGHS